MQTFLKNIVKLVFPLLMLVTIIVVNPLFAKAAGERRAWSYLSERAVVSVYDKYSSSSGFQSYEWKLLSESQAESISLSTSKVNIKTNREPQSGEVIFGIKTDNANIAFKALSNMTINGKTTAPYIIQQVENYKGTESGRIVIVRYDPFAEQEVKTDKAEIDSNYFVRWNVAVKNPRTTTQITFTDTAPYYYGGAYSNDAYYYFTTPKKGKGVKFNDLVAQYEYVNGYKRTTQMAKYYYVSANVKSTTGVASYNYSSTVKNSYIYMLSNKIVSFDLLTNSRSVQTEYKGASAKVTVAGGKITVALNEQATKYYYIKRYGLMSGLSNTELNKRLNDSKQRDSVNKAAFLAFIYSEGYTIIEKTNSPILPIYDGNKISFSSIINGTTYNNSYGPTDATITVKGIFGGNSWSEMKNWNIQDKDGKQSSVRYSEFVDFWEQAAVLSCTAKVLDRTPDIDWNADAFKTKAKGGEAIKTGSSTSTTSGTSTKTGTTTTTLGGTTSKNTYINTPYTNTSKHTLY